MTNPITADNLNHAMEFDRVMMVAENGAVTFPAGIYGPELNAMSDNDGSHLPETDADLQRQAESYRGGPWFLETGWTGQYRYSGPCMHSSEYIGGAMAEYILETPGYWVALIVQEDDFDSESWALAHKEFPTTS